MAKNEQILRIKFIEILLKERKAKGASYQEIEEYLEEKFADKDQVVKYMTEQIVEIYEKL